MMFSSSSKFQRQVKGKIRKRWRLFHATDFQSLMYPCFTFCRILGIFPYRITASIIEISKPLFIIYTIVTSVYCICGLIMLYTFNVSARIDMLHVPKNLEYNCYLIVTNFIAVVTFILSGPRRRLFQTILEISSKLRPESYQKLSWLIHTKDIFGFLYTFGMIITNSAISGLLSDTNIFRKFFDVYTSLLVFQIDMIYMNSVCVLKACFKKINDNLANLQKLVMNDEPQFLRLIYHERRNPFLLMELKALKKWHLMISDAVQMLNIIFSLPLLATIIMTFTEITFFLYYYINYIQLQGEDGLISVMEKQFYNWFVVVYMTYFLIKIILIVWACETGKNQALEIGTTVHEVLNCISDKQIKHELQLFSLQILHRENTFSTKGFTVDATLLAAMVGNITTYLLILVQFLHASHSCDEKTKINVTQFD